MGEDKGFWRLGKRGGEEREGRGAELLDVGTGREAVDYAAGHSSWNGAESADLLFKLLGGQVDGGVKVLILLRSVEELVSQVDSVAEYVHSPRVFGYNELLPPAPK